jgi:hypothetical protein
MISLELIITFDTLDPETVLLDPGARQDALSNVLVPVFVNVQVEGVRVLK